MRSVTHQRWIQSWALVVTTSVCSSIFPFLIFQCSKNGIEEPFRIGSQTSTIHKFRRWYDGLKARWKDHIIIKVALVWGYSKEIAYRMASQCHKKVLMCGQKCSSTAINTISSSSSCGLKQWSVIESVTAETSTPWATLAVQGGRPLSFEKGKGRGEVVPTELPH